MEEVMGDTKRAEFAPGGRRGVNGWLLLAAGLILLPLLVLLAPIVRPIDAQLGPMHLWAGTTVRHATMTRDQPRQGLAPISFTTREVHDLNNQPYRVRGAVTGCTLRLADWVYYVIWFQGSSAAPPPPPPGSGPQAAP